MSDLRVVIVGGGRVGLRAAQLLDDRGQDVVVIERDPVRCELLSEEYVATVIEGNASYPSVLEQAAPERADVLAALTGDPGTNLAVCLAADRMTDHLYTVMRSGEADIEEYEGYVDAVVSPELAGAKAAVNAIVGVDVRTLESLTGDLEVIDVRVAEGAPAAGKRLADVRFPAGSVVVSDQDDDVVATADTVLEPGHRYLVAVESDVADEVMNLVRG